MSDWKPSILVVDDENTFRSAVLDLLQDVGFVCAAADSGEAALDCLAKQHYNIVFTDLRMPGIDGLALLREIKKIDESIIVVFITSHTSIDSTIEALRLGAYDYLIKPLEDIELILAMIHRITDKILLEAEKKSLLKNLQEKNRDLDESRQKIIQYSVDISALYTAEKEMLSGLDLEEVYQRSVAHISRLVGFKPALLWVFDKSRTKLVLKSHCRLGNLDEKSLSLEFPQVISRVSGDLKQALISKVTQGTALFHPVQGHQPFYGVLSILNLKRRPFSRRQKEMMTRFSFSVAVAIENAQLYHEVKTLGTRDALTGLFNRRHFEDIFKSELLRGARHHHPVSLIFFDVDYFKKYNDAHGHLMGDVVLRKLAELVQSRVRDTDIVCRYSGEEFIIVLPYTTKLDAKQLAEDIRQSVAAYKFPYGEQQPDGAVTISFGISESPLDGIGSEIVVKSADDALYRAKEMGRNCVC
ncbi:MAG: diguanylate cyclase [Nitrospirae bacterium]|nr:diguanylate cyclase [Candidatus Manganitrophaceae bacterium]